MFGLGAAFWWALLGLLFVFGELVIPGIILMFFGIGALLTALLVWVMPALSVTVQIIIFSVSSISSLILLRKYLRQMFTGKSKQSDEFEEGLVGEFAEVLEAIKPTKPGRVKLHGTAWKAESSEELEVGAQVTIVKQRSLVLIVKRK